MADDEPRTGFPQDQTEAKHRPRSHAPYAQMGTDDKKAKAPGIDEHESAGQGLSG